jgi:hypothetical protein
MAQAGGGSITLAICARGPTGGERVTEKPKPEGWLLRHFAISCGRSVLATTALLYLISQAFLGPSMHHFVVFVACMRSQGWIIGRSPQ